MDEGRLAGKVMTVWDDHGGLPSNTVLDLAQDGSGFIWIASYDGLVRFDGSSFSLFSRADGRGFGAESARELELGPDGALWIGTNDDGLYRLEGGSFRRFGAEDGLGDLSIRALGFEGETLWVGTAKGVFRYAGSRFEAVPAPAGFGIASFFTAVPGLGALASSNFPGLFVAKPEGLAPWQGPKELASSSFSAACLDRSGVLWLGTTYGRVYRVRDGAVIERHDLDKAESASVNAFLGQADGTMRVGTDKGVFSWKAGAWTGFGADDGLPNDVVSSLLEDREGSLWVGTERGGLVKFSGGKFLTLDRKEGLVDEAVNAATEDSFGSLWVATDLGVSFHPSASDPIGSDRKRRRAVDSLLAGFKGVRVRQIRLARDGSLWFSCYSERSLVRFDGASASAFGKKDGLPSDRVRMSYEAADGRVLAGTTSGIALLGTGPIASIGPAQGLPNHYVMDLIEDGNLLLAATDGGGVAEIAGGKVSGIVDKAAGLAGNVVFRFVRDSAKRLWVCTAEGVSLWEGGRSAGSVDAAKGLPWNSVFQIVEAERGTLWLVSSKGVASVGGDELEAAARGGKAVRPRVIDRRDGLAGQLSANAWAYRNEGGEIYLPTLAGVSVYGAGRAAKNAVPPPVLVEGVEVDGKAFNPVPSSLELRPGTQRVTFRFAALSFVEPSKVSCRYRLEGYDTAWVDAGAERSVSYTNLPPGDYAFLAAASNDDGVPSAAEARLEVSQRPFLWQRPLFYVAAAIVLIAAGFLAAVARVRKLERRRQELERIVQERTKDLEDEKSTSEALLLNILPYRVADELKRTGSSTPQLYPDVTVLFADLVGFTEACGELSPERTIEELNTLFTIFDDIVAEHGGERIKTIGDAYLAASGLDGRDPAHSFRMCSAARDIMIEVERLSLSSRVPWHLRIGVHAGPVIGGVVGVRKYVFDIFGDTVNVASRLQSSSVPTGICASLAVADRVRSLLPVLDRPPRAVKGKGEMAMAFVAWKGGDAALASERSRAGYRAGMEAYAAADYHRALDSLGAVDFSLTEPEEGYRAWRAIGACSLRAGNSAAAAKAWRRALSYGIDDPDGGDGLDDELDAIGCE
jgi:class 3 adenylate cyclase/ligand-binding sensor domain-containing protein